MVLRRAETGDLADLVALQRAAYAQNEALLGITPAPLLADYADVLRDMECWLSASDTRLDGALILDFRADDMLIWSVAAHPDSRGSGVGSALLQFAEQRAREEGRDTIRLYTAKVYEFNVAWYLRSGFSVESEEDYRGRTRVNMIKKLQI
jgi:ribosomal protein S18 acetylase RimI-like enzyme